MDKIREQNWHLISLIRKRKARITHLRKITDGHSIGEQGENGESDGGKDEDNGDAGKMDEEVGDVFEICNSNHQGDTDEFWVNKR